MSRRRQFELIVLAVPLAGAVFAWQYRLRFPFDDTFISFRYAEHLADGHGLVWNIGAEHTEGYTNFLFVALLAGTRMLTSDLLAASQILTLSCTIFTALALQRLASHVRTEKTGLISAALYLLAPLTWINALSGMETSVFVMLIILALLAYSKRLMFIAYAFSMLATLTRPEGALLGALIVSVSFSQDRRTSLLAIFSCFILPLATYAVWKYFYFGYLLPNSFYIKVSESSKLFPGLQYVRMFVMSVVTLLVATVGIRSRRAHPVLVVASLWAAKLLVF
jgi:arabinofuranosyltransferase